MFVEVFIIILLTIIMICIYDIMVKPFLIWSCDSMLNYTNDKESVVLCAFTWIMIIIGICAVLEGINVI